MRKTKNDVKRENQVKIVPSILPLHDTVPVRLEKEARNMKLPVKHEVMQTVIQPLSDYLRPGCLGNVREKKHGRVTYLCFCTVAII